MKKLTTLTAFALIILSSLIVLNSCSKKEETNDYPELEEYTGSNLDEDAILDDMFSSTDPNLKCAGSWEICGDVKIYPLIASKRYLAGALLVYNDKDNMYVTYYSWCYAMKNFHLYVGTEDNLPLDSENNPQINQFAKKHSSYAKVKTFTIPLSEVSECNIIAAHAVLGRHTIWAYGTEEFEGGNWGWYNNVCNEKCPEEKIFAVKTWLVDTTRDYRFWGTLSTGEAAFNTGGYWCDYMSIVVPENGASYNLLENYSTDKIIGSIETDFTKNTLVVTLNNTMDNVIFTESYVFYGTQEEFDATMERCPRYDWWPNVQNEPAKTHILEIPLN